MELHHLPHINVEIASLWMFRTAYYIEIAALKRDVESARMREPRHFHAIKRCTFYWFACDLRTTISLCRLYVWMVVAVSLIFFFQLPFFPLPTLNKSFLLILYWFNMLLGNAFSMSMSRSSYKTHQCNGCNAMQCISRLFNRFRD